MSRTRRLREAVLVLLEEKGTANTVEVFDHLNESSIKKLNCSAIGFRIE